MTPNTEDYATDNHGWAELLPRRQPTTPLTGDHRVPWTVIGAGFTGLACARRLAQLHPNDEILLLEARKVGQAASGRNSGFAVAVSHFPGPSDAAKSEEYARVNRINRTGLDLLRSQVMDLGIECQWGDEGFHHAAADKQAVKECENFRRYLESNDIPHTYLNANDLEARLGTKLYQTGIHVDQGVLVQPAALVRGLSDSLPANIRLFEQSPVLEIETGEKTTLRLVNATVETDKLILATNYEIAKLNILKRYLVGSTLSGSFTRVLNDQEFASLGSLSEWGVLSLHGGGATVRLTADRRICLRNAAEYHGGRLLSDTLLTKRQAIHRAGFEKRFPQLRHVPFEFAWSGVEGISRNGTNFFGRQKQIVYFAGGYNGSGVSRGTAFGWALADFASGGQSKLIDDCLASAPASWIPPRPFLDIGALFTVRNRFRGVGRDR